MKRQDGAYLQGQRILNPDNKNTWIIYCANWDFTDKEWIYQLILQNNKTPRVMEVYGEKLKGLIKCKKLELI